MISLLMDQKQFLIQVLSDAVLSVVSPQLSVLRTNPDV